MLLPEMTAEERVKFYLACFGFICVSSAALIADTAADTYFLSTFDYNVLSYMYLGTALLVGVIAYIFSVLTFRVAIDRLIVRTCACLLIAVLVMRGMLFYPSNAITIAAYYYGDLLFYIPMLLFWNFAGYIFNPREAKRLLGFIGAGGTVGCIASGYMIKPFVARFGIENLFLLVGFLIGGFAFSVAMLKKSVPELKRSFQARPGAERHRIKLGYMKSLLGNRQIYFLTLLAVIETITLMLIDFQFKAGVRTQYHGEELAGFFGMFYGSANMIALMIQLFAIRYILKKGGVLLALRILPATLLAFSVIGTISASFGWIVLSKFIVQILSFAIYSIAIQLLFIGVKKQTRSQTRSFIDGIVKPASIAVSGIIVIIFCRLFPLHALSAICVILIAVWLLLIKKNHGEYVTALMESLDTHRMDVSRETISLYGKEFEDQIRAKLKRASDEDLPAIIEMASTLNVMNLAVDISKLLSSESVSVKIAAMKYIRQFESYGISDELLTLQNHPDMTLCTSAIFLLCERGSEEIQKSMICHLEHDNLALGVEAAKGLINSENVKCRDAAESYFDRLYASKHSDKLIASAELIAYSDNYQHAVEVLLNLLQNPDPNVRIAALQNSRKFFSPEIMSMSVSLLSDISVSRDAEASIISFGRNAVPFLVEKLSLHDHENVGDISDRIPILLAKSGDPSAIPVLRKLISDGGEKLRNSAIRGYCLLIGIENTVKPYVADIENILTDEINAAIKITDAFGNIMELSNTGLLFTVLEESYNKHLRNMLILLDTLIPKSRFIASYPALTGKNPSNRPKAIEFLDNTLPGKFHSLVMGIVETYQTSNTISREELPSFLSRLAVDESDWVVAGALNAIGLNRLTACVDTVIGCLRHSNSTVRETALYVLSLIGLPTQVQSGARLLSGDQSERVSKLAAGML